MEWIQEGTIFFLEYFHLLLELSSGNEQWNDDHNNDLYAFLWRVGERTSGRGIYGRKDFYWRWKEELVGKDFGLLVGWLVVGVLWHINSFYTNNQFYFNEYTVKLSKTFLFQAIQFSQAVLIPPIQFSISTDFVYTQLNVKTVLY